jgi:cytochrome bd-type quinol oxidase subunit 2
LPAQILLVLSLLALIPCFYIFDFLDANGMKGGVGRMYGSWAALFSFPLVIVATQLRILFVKQYKRCVTAGCVCAPLDRVVLTRALLAMNTDTT